MKRLTALDLGFLLIEKRTQPMHIGYLGLFQPPQDAPPDFVQKLAERLRSYSTPQSPFNRRLQRQITGSVWVEDPEFDIEQHVIHLSLPKPGRIRELLGLVSRVHSTHLDRAYPLWRTYLIEGLEDGRIATYSKMHHALADGIGGTRLMLKSMSPSPEAQIPPAWAIPPREHRRRGDAAFAPLSNLAQVVGALGQSVGNLQAIAREVRQSINELRANHPDVVSGFQAPRCILNQPITGSRRYAAQSYSLARVKAVGKALGCTVNDVVLGMCASALRRYLMDLDALPDKPLLAACPVSLRRDYGTDGNSVALMVTSLGTHVADPAARMEVIKRSVEHNKARYLRMKPGEILGYNVAMLGPRMLSMLTGTDPRQQAFNVVISNVPGPKTPLYWQGCRLDGLYPASFIFNGQALNITLASRVDSLDFGVLACRRTLPSIQRLLDYLEEGLKELEAVVA